MGFPATFPFEDDEETIKPTSVPTYTFETEDQGNIEVPKKIIEEFNIKKLDSNTSVEELIKQQIGTIHSGEDPFFLINLNSVVNQYKQWKMYLPRVIPYYAVKCNNDLPIIKTLASFGCGFDCASTGEIEMITNLGIAADRIIYANPCKPPSHIKASQKLNVKLMTFDNGPELEKIAKIYPGAELVLRVLTDDSRSVCRFGEKYGAPPKTCRYLLNLAKSKGLKVVGVSFHVGSGCYDTSAFVDALEVAKNVFDLAKSLGFKFNILDIGGGFPGSCENSVYGSSISFSDIALAISPKLDELFPKDIKVIAEPGRYFVSSSHVLAAYVIARRDIDQIDEVPADSDLNIVGSPPSISHLNDDDNEQGYLYYINDGVYGSFNNTMYDHAIVQPFPLFLDPKKNQEYKEQLKNHSNLLETETNSSPRFFGSQNGFSLRTSEENNFTFKATVFGPTCDSLDCVAKNVRLPKLDVGDWMFFLEMGAYTSCASSNFNGFPFPKSYHVMY